MARQNLRRYLTEEELQDYQPTISSVDTNVLIAAEEDIDNVLPFNFEGAYSKAYFGETIYGECIISNTTAVLSNFSAMDGYLSRTTLEILSGDNLGARLAIKSQVGTTLTFWEPSGITGTVACKIWQFAKCPFTKDIYNYDSTIAKLVDERIKVAVALQYVYRIVNANGLDVKFPVKSESLNGENYSFNYDTTSQMSILERISPQALDVIRPLIPKSLT